MNAQVDFDCLMEQAWSARENAYAPYSKFAVGAALLTASGEIFCGCNVENLSLGLTLCAERAAAAAAVHAGQRQFTALAVVAASALPVVPCGACRQFLAEFNPSLSICSAGRSGERKEWSLLQLLPSATDGILDWAR